jgi:hypothetical protein
MSDVFLDVEDNAVRTGLKGPRAAEWLAGQGVMLPPEPNSWTMSPWSPVPSGPTLAPPGPTPAPPGQTLAPSGRVMSASGNTGSLRVARLGHTEFFVEDEGSGAALQGLSSALASAPTGVYPVLREDFAFRLGGAAVHEVLAQVCSLDFAALDLDSRPVIMTLMIGVAVLAMPERVEGAGAGGARVEGAGAAGVGGAGAAGVAGAARVAGAGGAHVGGAAERRYRFWCDPTFGPDLSETLSRVVVDCGGTTRGVLE